jgi:hypothetical protein
VIVIEAEPGRKRIRATSGMRTRTTLLDRYSSPFLAAGGCRRASRMELLPSVLTKRKTGRKGLRKINKSSARTDLHRAE